jgi:hypothetical protein
MQHVITLLKIAKNREIIQLFLYEYIMGRNSKVDHTFLVSFHSLEGLRASPPGR